MEFRAQEVKAGIFILISIIVLFAFLIAITGVDLWTEKSQYKVRFSYVGGIEIGSIVRLGGMEVGKVTGIELPNDGDPRIQLILEVEEGTPIRTDSRAIITTIGLMGSQYVEVSTGSPSQPLLQSGETIQSKDVTAFAQMAGSLTEISNKLSELLDRVNDIFNSENRENLGSTLANLNRIMEQSSDNMNSILGNMNNTAVKLNETITLVNKMLTASDTSFAQYNVNFKEILENTKLLLANLNQTMDDFDATLLSNKDDYYDIIENLTTLTKNIQEFSQTLKEKPWSLVRKNTPSPRKMP